MPTNENTIGETGRHDPILTLELYIDLISRVIPGAVLIVGLCYYDFGGSKNWIAERLSADKEFLKMSWGVALSMLIVSLICAYAVGMFLTPIGYMLSWPYYVQAWFDINDKQRDLFNVWHQNILGDKKPSKAWTGNPFYRFWYWFMMKEPSAQAAKAANKNTGVNRVKDWISRRRAYAVFDMALHEDLKQRDMRAAVILPKMRAEASLCVNLAAALLCVWLVAWHSTTFLRPTLTFVALVLLLIVTSGFRFARFLSRTFTFMRMHEDEIIKVRANGT